MPVFEDDNQWLLATPDIEEVTATKAGPVPL